jgi:hypothetical protein
MMSFMAVAPEAVPEDALENPGIASMAPQSSGHSQQFLITRIWLVRYGERGEANPLGNWISASLGLTSR